MNKDVVRLKTARVQFASLGFPSETKQLVRLKIDFAPQAEDHRRVEPVAGRRLELQVRRQMEPGCDGHVVEQFDTVLVANRHGARGERFDVFAHADVIVPDAERILLAEPPGVRSAYAERGGPFDRVRIAIGDTAVAEDPPTPRRIAAVHPDRLIQKGINRP